ncbi:MAG: hypothetical protein JW838_06455 [Spirochaetes bacterium]|nr:hypothetical protein [Spirochaetota bacterium]
MLKQFTEEVFRKIVEYNSKINHEAIPHSDTFEREIRSLVGIGKPEFDRIIGVLKDSHRIFTFEIVKEDRENEIRRVEGYVEADLQTLRKLKNYFQKLLMDEYESQYHRRMLVHQIVKDMYARPGFYKNTLIGQIGNKAIMLEEYENLIERNFTEYTEIWKTRKFSEVLTEAEAAHLEGEEAGGEKEPESSKKVSKRAVDSPNYADFTSQQSKQSLSKVLQIYGVEFFFRINLRKYNFDLLREIVESGEIDRRGDLQILKEMIQKMKQNTDRDPELSRHTEQIYRLERIISRHMLYSK